MAVSKALINSEILQWAINRAGINIGSLSKKYKKIQQWINNEEKPTFKQAITIAKELQIPFGYLYLKNPPEEKLPIPDLRRFNNKEISLSPTFIALLNDIFRKQTWYEEYAIKNELAEVKHIGKFDIRGDYKTVANDIKKKIDFTSIPKNKSNILTNSIKRIENIGILVMKNSVLGSNTHRALDEFEFRGFSIYDKHAPLIFINARDSKNAQLFTLFHELAHLWIGSSGVSNSSTGDLENIHQIELFCNQVAAEILMPEKKFRSLFLQTRDIQKAIDDLSSYFCVSKLATINRSYNLKLIDKDAYNRMYNKAKDDYINRASSKTTKQSSGGNPYYTMRTRVGERFSTAVFYSTMEGNTLHRDAGYLLNIDPMKIYKYANKLGIQ